MSNEIEKVTRKLRAILSADVKGYSLLMSDDEVHTIQTLKTYRSLMSDLIQQHSGRVVDNPGDNLLAEFGSAVDSVEASVAIQNKLKKENARYVEDRRLQFRIGINIGDIVQDGDRIYGEGVNVAARIESLADAGGICISRGTYDHIKGKIDLDFGYIGEHEVKNIKEPVRVYKVLMGTDTPKPFDEEQFELTDKPSIAVLPFDNMSGDPEQQYFSDGITEDIITALSRSSWMFVIARNSSFSYRGQAIDVKTASKELGVRYILEGSVRKAGNKVRVTAQLIDGLNGKHVWAEKYDGQLEDIFDLQDQITQKVVASTLTQIHLSLGEGQAKVVRQKLSTWDLIAKAWEEGYRFTESSTEKCELLFRKAVASDPTSSTAYCFLAATLIHKVAMGFVSDEDTTEIVDEAYELAKRAVSLDEQNDNAHWVLGYILLYRKDHDRSIAEQKRAIEINPNCSLAYGSLGTVLSFSGEPDESIRNNEIAIRTNPRDISIFFRYSGIAMAHFVAGRYEESVQWSRKSIHRKPNWRLGHISLISSLAHLGRVDEAKQAIDNFLKNEPDASVSGFDYLPFKKSEDLLHLQDGLRKAGLRD